MATTVYVENIDCSLEVRIRMVITKKVIPASVLHEVFMIPGGLEVMVVTDGGYEPLNEEEDGFKLPAELREVELRVRGEQDCAVNEGMEKTALVIYQFCTRKMIQVQKMKHPYLFSSSYMGDVTVPRGTLGATSARKHLQINEQIIGMCDSW